MGIVIGISIACMDVFNYLLYSTKMIENTASVIVLLIFNRVTMVILGEKYWVYGFMGLYMIYALALLYLVAKDTIPLCNQVVIRKFKNPK